ncbi:MAG: lytic transglycosylase domain-containing protein [Spirochaetota bacterium]|nr:lytic transglycosylase domain-containing protein [Spirochaetota bacterium]
MNDGTVEYYSVDKSKKDNTHKRTAFKSTYNRLIKKISSQEGVETYLIQCIIKIESNFKADAVSKAGAMGLMQIMQETSRFYNIQDPLDPEENLRAGIKHFKSLLQYFKNDIPLALAAYHAGLGRVKKSLKIPSIKSTIDYVTKIMRLYNGQSINSIGPKVKRLYKRIERNGTIVIYN